MCVRGRQAFLNEDSSLIPSDAHVCRQPKKKPLNSALKYYDPTPAKASFHWPIVPLELHFSLEHTSRTQHEAFRTIVFVPLFEQGCLFSSFRLQYTVGVNPAVS